MRAATRTRPIMSSSSTFEPVHRAGPGRPTYSGRAIEEGTERRGLTVPGTRALRGACTDDIPGSLRKGGHRSRVGCPAGKERAMADGFYFNIETHEVEEGRQSDYTKLMGPYPTREAAAQALETARRRNQAWDEQDQQR